jgi:hypothetical protein
MTEHPLDRTALLLELDAFPGAPESELIESLLGSSARISADRASVMSPAGQTTVVATVIALAQMGLALELDVPDVPLLGPQPPLIGDRLGAGLADLVADLIQPLKSVERPDLTVAIGEAHAGSDAYQVTGGEFSATVAVGGEPRRWEGTAPLGGALAGVITGAAALPIVLRRAERLLGRTAPAYLRALHPDSAVSLPALDLRTVEVGELDFISGGAITNATLFTLLRVQRLRGRGRVFDDDALGPANLNRYSLARRSFIGLDKVEMLALVAAGIFELSAEPMRFNEHSGVTLAERVLVGVDDIRARWDVQRRAPGWLHVGATSHFEVMATSHPPGGPCAGCSHPRASDAGANDRIPTISFASELAGILQAHALLAHATGAPVSSWYAWANNVGGRSGLLSFEPAPVADCPLPCRASLASRTRAA